MFIFTLWPFRLVFAWNSDFDFTERLEQKKGR